MSKMCHASRVLTNMPTATPCEKKTALLIILLFNQVVHSTDSAVTPKAMTSTSCNTGEIISRESAIDAEQAKIASPTKTNLKMLSITTVLSFNSR